MTLRLTLISNEEEDFILEFKIDADATFADLHRLIINHCGYEERPGQRFYICDEHWKPIQRILLSDEEGTSADEDLYLMAKTDLREFLEEEGQRMAYRFDPEGRRKFLLELTETTFSDPVEAGGKLTRRHGQAPRQELSDEPMDPVKPTAETEELEENFYGEEGYEEGDIDMEGFDILD